MIKENKFELSYKLEFTLLPESAFSFEKIKKNVKSSQ